MPDTVFRGNPLRRFLRSWGNPEQQYAIDQQTRAYRYARDWDLYSGVAFSNQYDWAEYKKTYGLYRAIRQIWDHTHQLVEFYVSHIWSGSLASDGLTLPEGVPNAVPLSSTIDPTLAAAIGQLWTWWNFQETKDLIVRYTAALGEMLVELTDDPERGKVMLNLVWPAYVKSVVLDEAGNLKEYVIEYVVKDRKTQKTFQYRRKVDGEFFTTYKDGEPFDYTKDPLPVGTQPYGDYVVGDGDGEWQDSEADGSKIVNPYGFVPAVWFRHFRTLGVRGEPAIWATRSELDEANQLFSHLLDKAHVTLEAPIIVSGNVAPNALQRAMTNMVGTAKRLGSDLLGDDAPIEREGLNVLEGPAGTRVETIELKITDAMLALDRIVAGIERKCPEITLYQELRRMTQVTGPASVQLLGDVNKNVAKLSSGYDRNLIRIHQMAVTICGMRLAEGEGKWADASIEQQKFAGFNLDSYDAGKLDHTIMPRNVVPTTAEEVYALLQQKKTVLGDLIPPRVLALEGGYKEEEVAKWEKEQEDRAQKAMEQQQALAAASPTPIRPPGKNGAPPGGPQRGAPSQNHRPDADTANTRVARSGD